MLAYQPLIQTIHTSFNYQVDVLRLDKLHQSITGNKWFKLKYNLQNAIDNNLQTVITFGGAYSNHIAATASACKLFGLKCIGIIRGDESELLNTTLQKAKENGMLLEFISRNTYLKKNEQAFNNYLQNKYGQHYLIPEGGNNLEGALGCQEIIKPEWNYDYILCACGTATTFTGIIASAKNTVIVGISVLKGENKLPFEVKKLLNKLNLKTNFIINGNEELYKSELNNNCILSDYSFNGYANYYKPLIDFKNQFETKYKIPLDYIYTNKLFFASFDLIQKEKFKKKSKILIIHSGGLQGNIGFEERFRNKFT